MARLTAFSVGGSRAFSRNRAIDPSFKIWKAHMTVHHKSEAEIVTHSTHFHLSVYYMWQMIKLHIRRLTAISKITEHVFQLGWANCINAKNSQGDNGKFAETCFHF